MGSIIDAELRKEIEEKLVAQLLDWDKGNTQELFAKGLFAGKEAELMELIGNQINPQCFKVLMGKDEYEAVHGESIRDFNLKKHTAFSVKGEPFDFGKVVVAVSSAVEGTLNTNAGGSNVASGGKELRKSADGVILNSYAKNAANNLGLFLSKVIAFTREGKDAASLRTLGVPTQEWVTPGLMTARTAEDLVNGLNVVLDKRYQIDTNLLRSR